jgi:uncharacterized protein YukE
MSSSRVSGDSDGIQDLADIEEYYKEQLGLILSAVDGSVQGMRAEWQGDTSKNFDESYAEFGELKKAVEDSFEDLIRKTREAGDTWSVTAASVRTKFTL